MHTIRFRRITAGSLFKLTTTAMFALLLPLILFCGVLSLFGYRTIQVDLQPVFGLKGLLTSLVMAPIFSLGASVAIWTPLYIGILIWSFFASITIVYVPVDKPKP
jgi:hypothetical protein